MRRIFFTFGMSLAISLAAHAEDRAPERWEKAIAAFEAQDKANPPKPGGILFLGSSSIRMWDLGRWFPDLPVLNRGFGGSEISDSIHYFDRVVVPYKPSAIVFYAGDNDMARGKSAEQVASDFKAFAGKVWEALPDTRILFIGIKPSTARWNLYPEMKKANQRIQAYAGEEARLTFVDIEADMLGADGAPRKDLLKDDGLHMTEEGYRIWTDSVTAALPRDPVPGDSEEQ
jgi:lysophospholipase L1-like esterase